MSCAGASSPFRDWRHPPISFFFFGDAMDYSAIENCRYADGVPYCGEKPGSFGLLIVVEGLDGVGKSTAVSELFGHYRSMGIRTAAIAQLGTGKHSNYVRDFIVNKRVDLSPRAAELFSETNSIELDLNVIQPLLRDGTVVIMDRGYISALVYQSQIKSQGALDFHTRMVASGLRDPRAVIYDPHVTVYLSLPRAQRLQRCQVNDAMDVEVQSRAEAYEKAYADVIAGLPTDLRDVLIYEVGDQTPSEVGHGIASMVRARYPRKRLI